MSEKWEVVTKKKDKNSKLPIPKINGSNTNKDVKGKKNLLNGVKIEDVLPKSQVQNLYSNSKLNKENKKPQEKNKQEKTEKKSNKKDKPQEPPKPKPPKTIQSALNAIDVDEFNSIFEKSKNQYPDAPIVWLKELVQFLNQKVPVELQDHVFSSKPEGYPLNLVPSGLKDVIEKSVKDAGKDNTQLFFDICLTSMATDMSRGFSALGNKFYLQYISTTEPKLISLNISKHVTLRNSYQNRPNIGLSILWAVGHVGVTDLHSGLTIFRELFLPLLEMKNYSRFVVKYLVDLLNRKYDQPISKEEYLLILDTIYSDKKNVPADLKGELSRKVPNLKAVLFKNRDKHHAYVELFLKKLATNSNKSYQTCICDVLVDIFINDTATLSSWNKVYAKNVAASSVLLRHIGDNWKSIAKRIDKRAVGDALTNFKAVNEELSQRKRREEGLGDAVTSIKRIEEKMVVNRRSVLLFKIVSLSVILAVTGFMFIDIMLQGWKGSRTSKTFKEYGVCEYGHKGVAKVKDGWAWVDARLEENFPGYHKTVVDFGSPYVQLLSDLGKVTCNALYNVKQVAVEKYPSVLQTIDSYAPGLVEQSQKAVTNVYSTSILFYNKSVDYLRKEIFVGQFSPENVQRVVIEAFNTTQQKATEYYHWLYEKVQTSIK